MIFKKTQIALCLLFSLLALVGCSEKADENDSTSAAKMETVDTAKPIVEVQAEAKTMSNEDLKATANKYKEALLAKQDEVKDMAAKIKDIPIADILGQEAQTFKADLKNLESTLTAIKGRFQVYYDKLKEKGGNLSGLEL
jgi:uncharacterized lipoprotein NlpE involved in copper resistance